MSLVLLEVPFRHSATTYYQNFTTPPEELPPASCNLFVSAPDVLTDEAPIEF